MFISPKIAIERGWVKIPEGVNVEKCIQPNAIDFTLDKVCVFNADSYFQISENDKTMRTQRTLVPEYLYSLDDEKYWRLEAGSVYDGMSNFYVEVPEGIAAMLIVRSTFNRNGIFITSGLYDSGYKGACGFAIHNRGGVAFISPGTRIGQLIFIESQNAGLYAGGYNHNIGTHYTEKK